MVQDGRTNLPLELILRIIESLAPTTAVALPSHDTTAQTIRACTLVSKGTYPIALRLLYNHCLYIDTSDRLRLLLISLNHHLSHTNPPDLKTDYSDTSTTATTTIPSPSRHIPTIPQVNILPHLQNLYIAPFPPHTIDDLPTAQWVFELLSISRYTLRRLVSNIPLNTLPSWKDHLDVRVWLRRGFEQLTNLEEFVCLCDDLDLTLYEEAWASQPALTGPRARIPVWAKWTNLRRLSIRERDIEFSYSLQGYQHLRRFLRLESLVVVPSWQFSSEECRRLMDCVAEGRQSDVQVIWPDVVQHSDCDDFTGIYARHLERLSWARLWNLGRESCSSSGGENGARVKVRAIVVDPEYAPAEEEKGLLHLQTWMRERAVEGCLWDIEPSARFRPSVLDPALWIDASFHDGGWVPEWVEEYT